MKSAINKILNFSETIFLLIFMLSCSGGGSDNVVLEKLAFDLVSNFKNATIEDSNFTAKYKEISKYNKIFKDPWAFNSPRLVKAGFEINKKKMFQNIRRSIYLGAHKGSPCKISIPIKIERGSNSFLSFAVSGYKLSGKSSKRELTIRLNDSKENKIIFKSHADKNIIPEMQWLDLSADLPDGDFENPEIEIEFKSNSRLTEHIFIANPRIFKKESETENFPNVIFICIDALRADAVDSIIEKYHLTPNIDSLAKDGIAFRNHFIVTNWTRPSTISMLSSVYASDTGVNQYYPPVSDEEKYFFYNESGVIPITSVLKQYNYLTGSIGNNSFIIDYNDIGIDMNFDELSEYETQWEDTIDITNEVISWIRNNRKRKFFLYINYNAPHSAYIPPKKYLNPLKKRIRNIHPWFRAYLGEVAYTDDYLGKVIEEVKKLKLYDKTIIVITSDHGEIFSKEHEFSPFTDARALYSHGQTQLDEELRVPLIIKPHDSYDAGVQVDAQVRNIDIVPTILDLMNIKAPKIYKGKSLMPVVHGIEHGERILYSEGRMMYSVRAEGYKYAERFYGFGIRPHHWGGDVVNEYRELFDLKRDPGELNNIVDSKPRIAEKMRVILKKMRFKQSKNILYAKGIDIKGRIRTAKGFFYDINVSGAGSSIKRISRKEYAFKLSKEESLIYYTIPKNADVRVRIINNGSKILAGKYLLPLISCNSNRIHLVDPSIKMTHEEPNNDLLSLVDKGILYWVIPLKSGIREIKREKYLSRDINRLLEKWGYIQGKEKKNEKI